jgi:outer membrane protein
MLVTKQSKRILIKLTLCAMISIKAMTANAISLTDAYDLAANYDPSLAQARYKLQVSTQEIIQAKSTLLPTINGQIQADWNNDADSNSTDSQSYTINLTQALYAPALSSAINKVRNLDLQASLIFQQTEQLLVVNTVNAYIDAMVAHNNMASSQAQEISFKKSLARIRAQFEVGISANEDVQEAQAVYDNAKIALIISEGALENSLDLLQRLTGSSIHSINSLSTDYPTVLLEPSDAEHWVEQATSNNLDILLGKKAVESSRFDTQIASAERKPKVDIKAYHQRYNHNTNGNTTDNQVALVLSVPLFNGGALNSKVRQSAILENIEKSKHLDTIRSITQQTKSTVRDIRTNALAINARKQSIVSSLAAMKAIKEGYKLGTRNITDLLDAEQKLFQAKNEHSNARLKHISLLFNLKKLLGSVAKDDITQLSQWMLPAK